MEKGYLLGQITISDKSHYKLYDSKIGNVIEKFGGRYLVKGGLRMVKEGTPSFQRDVLVEFKDIETAQRFFLRSNLKKLASLERLVRVAFCYY